jgi:hypothetical protein
LIAEGLRGLVEQLRAFLRPGGLVSVEGQLAGADGQ